MALASPHHRLVTDHLRYFHPLRAVITLAVILALGSAVVLYGWFEARHAKTVLGGALVTLALLFLTVRAFLPRTLTADGTAIRWKIYGRPPARQARQAQVRAIQFLTSSGPGRQRFYFVDRDSAALLWVDRFSPAEMLAFANSLGVQIRPVETPPPVAAETQAVEERWRAVGRKRAQVAAFATVGLLGLAVSIFLAVIAFRSVSEWSAFQRVGICQQPPRDPLSCRLETAATVTAVDVRQSWTGVTLRFPQDTLSGGDSRSTFVWLLPGSHPQPPLATGATVTAEVFDRQYVTAVNDASTQDYKTMKSNASWWYALVPLFMPVVGGYFAYGSWKSDVSSFERDEDERKKKVRGSVSWPGWLRPVGRAGSRLWIAWVG